MKTLLIATAALSLFAAPALAQSGPTDVPLTGSVTARCGGGGADPLSNVLLIPGDMTDSDGRLSVGPQTITLAGLWCNGPADVIMFATPLIQLGDGTDPLTGTATAIPSGAPFVNTLDLQISGGAVSFFGGGTLVSTPLSGTPTALTTTTTEAFSMPDSASTVVITMPAGSASTDRPLAGDYIAAVILAVTPAS
jgi:hypothetical protein